MTDRLFDLFMVFIFHYTYHSYHLHSFAVHMHTYMHIQYIYAAYFLNALGTTFLQNVSKCGEHSEDSEDFVVDIYGLIRI